MKALIQIIIMLTLLSSSANGQKKEYLTQCEIIEDIIDSANTIFFDFQNYATDSILIVLDVNDILKECEITFFAQTKINIVTSGAEIDKIKHDGIFSSPRRQKNLFVLTREPMDNLIGYRLFHPTSNGNFYWNFLEQKGRYVFQKKSMGWF